MPKIYYINHKKVSVGFVEEVEVSQQKFDSLRAPAGRKKPFIEKGLYLAAKDWYEDKETCAKIVLRRLQSDYIAKQQLADKAKVIFNQTTEFYAKEGIEL